MWRFCPEDPFDSTLQSACGANFYFAICDRLQFTKLSAHPFFVLELHWGPAPPMYHPTLLRSVPIIVPRWGQLVSCSNFLEGCDG